MASSSSSMPKPRSGWTYDVFLSFRGEDTRNTFVDHLYAALVQRGIHTFKDNLMLGAGKPISQELVKAIQKSMFAVVVLSKNYANSSWCLEELVKIMECQDQTGHKVLPVFYHVDPSDVREQNGSFATAFQEHENKFKGDMYLLRETANLSNVRGQKRDFATAFEQHEEMDKVKKWREALTAAASLTGYHVSGINGGEYGIVDKIVQEVSANIQPRYRESNLIGIQSHMDALNSLLGIEATEEVRIVGIYGMGGIGKTTIAQALFRRISYKFEGSSFIRDVRENSSTKTDICALQKKILGDILGDMSKIQDPESGADMIQYKLFDKKVFLVLDDVDDVKKLEFLAATHDWFCPGSRIIITTRDMHLLSDTDAKYKPDLLRMDQAVELFSRHAFRENIPPDGYKEISERAIRYTGRLPLALKVLGSFFRGRQACVWESALDRLAKLPNNEVYKTLKLSFDDLNDFEQKIFLDIACFFKGREVKDVTRILDSFCFHPAIGISVLIEKSLITIYNGRIRMHDLIQEMGKHICGNAPYSRLWDMDVMHDLVNKNRELQVIEGIVVRQDPKNGLNVNVFESMKNLRLLDVHDKFTCGEPTFLPDELRWLCWKNYPFLSLPVADMHKLVGLEMKYGNIERLWKGHKNMPNLKFINLEGARSLIRFPDVSGAPNVERLILSHCFNLVEVHESLGFLKRLIHLDMSYCSKLKCLPSGLEMSSLETLILSSCESLEKFPELSPCMVKLSHIDLSSCFKIEELPSSIIYLSNLSHLDLSECTSLEKIPYSIIYLSNLSHLDLSECTSLEKIPNSICDLNCLETLCLQLKPPASITFLDLTNLCSLRKLDLKWSQIRDKDFPENLHKLSSLEALNLSYNNELLELPASISHLSSLKQLDISECQKLQNWHGLPSGIQVLNASNCRSLRKIEDLSEDYRWLYNIYLNDCNELLEDEENERYLDKMLKQSFLKKYAAVDSCFSILVPGSMIPSWFKEQQHGSTIALQLHPKWQTEIMGFAICGEFRSRRLCYEPTMELRFENHGMHAPMPQFDCINTSSGTQYGKLWIAYVPFSLFEQLNDDDDKHWSHIIEGNLVISLSCSHGQSATRCGAQVVYKEKRDSAQQIEPSIPYWKWKLSQSYQNTFRISLN